MQNIHIKTQNIVDYSSEKLEGNLYTVVDGTILCMVIKTTKIDNAENDLIDFKICTPFKILNEQEQQSFSEKLNKLNFSLTNENSIAYFNHAGYEVAFYVQTETLNNALAKTIKQLSLNFENNPKIYSKTWLAEQYKNMLSENMDKNLKQMDETEQYNKPTSNFKL